MDDQKSKRAQQRARWERWASQNADKRHRKVKEWRKAHPEFRNRQRKNNYAKSSCDSRPTRNNGQPWTEEDLQLVFSHSECDRDLSLRIGRSVQAIQVARTRYRRTFFSSRSFSR